MKVRKAYKIIVGLLLLVAYIIATGIFVAGKYDDLRCKNVNIEIDNSYSFVSQDIISQILLEGGIIIDSTVKVSDINFAEIERLVDQNIYVGETQAYSDFSGNVFLKITQREPILRVITADSASFYLDKDMKVMPTCDYYTADVMLLSGNIKSQCFYSCDSVDNYMVNTNKKSLYIDDICKFVNYLQSEELWRNQVTQIYINMSNEVELVPRVGNHIIILGGLVDYEQKLNKLEAMYHEGFEITDWNAYSTINLKYKDQVICKKRNNG